MPTSAPSVVPDKTKKPTPIAAKANRLIANVRRLRRICGLMSDLFGYRGEIIEKRDSVEGDRRLLCRSGSIIHRGFRSRRAAPRDRAFEAAAARSRSRHHDQLRRFSLMT